MMWDSSLFRRRFGGGDGRSNFFAGRVDVSHPDGSLQGFVYQPSLNGGSHTPTPHHAPSAESDDQYAPLRVRDLFNFADLTPAIPAVDREYLYGSLDRKICDQYLGAFC